MYIRKNASINVTIFDVSTADVMEKKTIFDQVVKLHTDSIASLSKKDMVTRFVVPAIFGQGNTRVGNSSSDYAKRCLFNDILGHNKISNRQYFGDTRIINSISEDRKEQKSRRKVRQEAITGIDNAKVIVSENKTLKLINKYHDKLIKASNKDLSSDASDFRAEDALKRYFTISMEMTETVKPKFDPNTSILRTVDKILFIDTTYSISEMRLAFEHKARLFSVSNNSSVERALFDFRNPHTNEYIKELYQKYGIKETGLWKKDIEESFYNLEDGLNHLFPYESLFSEDEKKVESAYNIFIPVTYVLFLENSSHLFIPAQEIISERHTIRNPRFFIVEGAVPKFTGYPEFMQYQPNKTDKHYNMKSQSRVYTDLGEDMYSLKTTLINIPSSFSTRLLKSKLKTVEVAKPDTDNFYFFTEEQAAKITEKSNRVADNLFYIKFDGRLNLSYYTYALQIKLINKFASEGYYTGIGMDDFIRHGKLIESPFNFTLPELYNELVQKQEYLSTKFNSTGQTILSQDMFDYEKAELLFLYILRKVGIELVSLRRNKWNDPDMGTFLTCLKQNDYLFTRDNLNKLYLSDYSFSSMSNLNKAYFLELVFTMVKTMEKEEIFTKVEGFIEECKTTSVKEIKLYDSRNKLTETLTTLIKNNHPRDVRDKFARHLMQNKKLFSTPKYKLYHLLYRNDSLQLIPLLVCNTLINDYIERLINVSMVYCTYIKIFYDNTNCKVISDDGKATVFLTDVSTQLRVQQGYENFYSSRGYEMILIKRLLEKNSAKTEGKIETFEEFTDLLISEFSREYFSTRK